MGAKLDVKGTPTIIINGWKLGHRPTEQELGQMVQRILAGRPPFDRSRERYGLRGSEGPFSVVDLGTCG